LGIVLGENLPFLFSALFLIAGTSAARYAGPAMDPRHKEELIRAGFDGWTPNHDVRAPAQSNQGARPMIGGWLALLLIVAVFAYVASLFALGWLDTHWIGGVKL
jgi:hypothetical protein